VKLSLKGIGFRVLRAWSIREDELKAIKKESPSGLPWIQLFSLTDVCEVLVVGPNDEWVFGPFHPVSAFLDRQLHHQQLPVTNVIVLLCWGEST